jgi:hypothetical protein
MGHGSPEIGNDWDRYQWASKDARSGPGERVARWSLWEWASIPKPAGLIAMGAGASALSGSGNNPSGQHWAPELRRSR